MRSKKNISLAKIREIDSKLDLNSKESDSLKEEKRQLENQLIIPKVTEKHLNKYFLKTDYFNKKEKMLIFVTEVLSAYEYKGAKLQIHTNGTINIDPSYKGYFSSIGKEVEKEVWSKMVDKIYKVILNI